MDVILTNGSKLKAIDSNEENDWGGGGMRNPYERRRPGSFSLPGSLGL